MTPEIVKQTTGHARIPRLTPSAGRLRTPAVESALEVMDRAERSLREQRAHREKVPIPTPILVGNQ